MGPASAEAVNSLSWRFGLILAGVALAGAAFWGANREILGLFHDDGVYAVVAKSLFEGSGYRLVSLPGEPPQTKYPFLYSYLLSWLWSFGGDFPVNIGLLKGFNAALLAALFFAAVGFYRRSVSEGRIGAVCFGILLCTNPVTFTLTDYVLSDLLAVFFAVAALALCARDLNGGRSWRSWLPLGLAAGLACLTRSAAIPLVFAGAVHGFFNRGFRAAAFFIGTVLFLIAPWLFWVALTPRAHTGSLFDYYSAYDFAASGAAWSAAGQWSVIAGNARHLLGAVDMIFLLPLLPGFAFAIALFSALGIFFSFRRSDVFLWSFFLSSLALLLLWPFHPIRYSAPLVPILLLFLFRGIKGAQAGVARLPLVAPMRTALSWLLALPIAVALMLNGVWLSSFLFYTDDRTTRGLYGRHLPYVWSGFEETFAWVRENTSPDSILATAYDPMYFLYTGRKAIRPTLHRPASYFYPYGKAKPDVGTAGEIKPQLVNLGVRYLIIDPLDGFAEGEATLRLFDEITAAYGQKARMVFASSDGKHRVYALDPE